MAKYMQMVWNLIILLLKAHKIEKVMEHMLFLRDVIFFLVITGTILMTADFGNRNMCLLKISRQRQDVSYIHLLMQDGCDSIVEAGKIF